MGDTPIASAGFDGAADRFDAWCESMRPGHEIRAAPGSDDGRRVASAGWLVGDLFFNELELSPIAYSRQPRRAGDYLLVRMYGEGVSEGRLEDTVFRTRPGEIHLFDQAAACRGETGGRHRMRSVFMPYAAVGFEPRRHAGHILAGMETAVGRMLWSSMESLFAELPRAGRDEVAALADGFAGLVGTLLLAGHRSAACSHDFDTTRRRAMRRFLDQRLGDPELGVASLCAAFGASRATIYRDFADEGGVARFITRRRLERAFHDLARLPPDRGRVRRVAERWGFTCPYHFSRAFRQRFQLWPSEVHEAGQPAAARSDG